MENQEEIHDVLTLFEKKPSTDIPPVLEEYLKTVSKTGKTLFPWNRLKVLFINKVEQVMEQFNGDVPYDHLPPFPNVENTKYNEMQKRIVEAMQRFTGAPFTVQRICELVTQPRKHYTRCDKFLRGIEKNVMVVSTVDPFGRKIVSESSRLMVNGLDTNGFGQKSDLNEFTEGQPFGPILQSSWSNNNTASMWPAAGMLDSVDPLQKLSASMVAENAASNLNTNSPLNMPTGSENTTNSEKFGESSAATNISSGMPSPGFSALFQGKPHEDNPVNSSVGLVPPSGPRDPGLPREESGPQQEESDTSSECVQEADSESSASVEESQDTHGKSQEDTVVTQDKEVPPDPTDTDTTGDGPPEKKMRLEEDVTDSSSSGSPGEVDSQQDVESPQDIQSTRSPDQASEQPQSSCDEGEQEVTESSSTVCSDCGQESGDGEGEVSQSNLTAETPSTDSTTDEQKTNMDDDQSAVSSTDDSKQSQDTDSGGAEIDQKDNNSAEAEAEAETESVTKSEVNDRESETPEEESQEESGKEENEVSAASDLPENESEKSAAEDQQEESECSSAGEMMETDAVVEEKSDATGAQSTTEEAEPMEQE